MAVDAFMLNEENSSRVGGALKDRSMAGLMGHVGSGGLAGAVDYYNERPTPSILMVEFEGSAEEITESLNSLAEICDPGTRVVVVGSVNDVAFYRTLMRIGISEYLATPLAERQIVDALSAMVADPDARPKGRIIAVTGVRGGCGGSTVAHNLGYSLATQYDADVAILDLDMQFGTAALNLNVEARQGIFDCLSQVDRLDEQLLERYIVKYDDHLSVLGASASLNLPADINREALDKLVDIVSQRVPFVVLDLPSRWTEWISNSLIMADESVVVATPDLVSLRDVQNWLRHVNEHRGAERPVRVVLNKLGQAKKAELTEKDFEGATEDPVTISVPYDSAVFGTAANNGQPIGQISAKSKPALALDELATKLSGRHVTARKKKKGLFSRG